MVQHGVLAERLLRSHVLADVMVEDDILYAVNVFNLAGEMNSKCIVMSNEDGSKILVSVRDYGASVDKPAGGS